MKHLPIKFDKIISNKTILAIGIILVGDIKLQNKNIIVAKNYKNGHYKFKIIAFHLTSGSKISEIIIKFNGSSAPAPKPIRIVDI